MHCSIEIRKKRTLNRNSFHSCSIDKLFASLLSVFTNECDDQASVDPFFCKMDLALWYIFEHSGPHDRLQLFHNSGSPEQVKRFSGEQSNDFLYPIQIYQLPRLFRDLPFLLQARLIKYKQFICRDTMLAISRAAFQGYSSLTNLIERAGTWNCSLNYMNQVFWNQLDLLLFRCQPISFCPELCVGCLSAVPNSILSCGHQYMCSDCIYDVHKKAWKLSGRQAYLTARCRECSTYKKILRLQVYRCVELHRIPRRFVRALLCDIFWGFNTGVSISTYNRWQKHAQMQFQVAMKYRPTIASLLDIGMLYCLTHYASIRIYRVLLWEVEWDINDKGELEFVYTDTKGDQKVLKEIADLSEAFRHLDPYMQCMLVEYSIHVPGRILKIISKASDITVEQRKNLGDARLSRLSVQELRYIIDPLVVQEQYGQYDLAIILFLVNLTNIHMEANPVCRYCHKRHAAYIHECCGRFSACHHCEGSHSLYCEICKCSRKGTRILSRLQSALLV